MRDFEELLQTWQRSTAIMHIAHHRAAARYAQWHRRLGVFVAVLAAIVASSVFVAASKDKTEPWVLWITGSVSLVAAVVTGASNALDAGGKSQRHHASAAAFQGVRREVEEDLVRCRLGRPRASYDHIRKRWSAALEHAQPLPRDIHDDVAAKMPAIKDDGSIEHHP